MDDVDGIGTPLSTVVIVQLVALTIGLAGIWATRERDKSDEASTLTGDALEMYDRLRSELEDVKNDLDAAQIKIEDTTRENLDLSRQLKSVAHDVRVYKETLEEYEHQISMLQNSVEYLWAGTLENIAHMKKLDIDAPFVPEPRWRGGSLKDE